MKRDYILGMLKAIARDVDCDEEDVYPELRPSIAWLERLPSGCELVGIDTDSDPRGRGFVYDTGANRGNGSWVRIMIINPDDLTKAGSTSRRCPRHGAYERVCQECLDEQRGKR